MLPTFADPKTDFVFERIFGAEARKPLLAALLNHLLELEDDRCIVELQHLPAEQHVDLPELKLSIVDVKCTDATGRRFVVEMQVLKVEGLREARRLQRQQGVRDAAPQRGRVPGPVRRGRRDDLQLQPVA
ncbi:MAG TPA: PD-(D/E)XK nuclease family transposase [Kofleriaceae bacterium]|nr:PD-(D/E)XK nuclease family transposase [Kofleriaceae bacterium]